jgi:hypothetical protein
MPMKRTASVVPAMSREGLVTVKVRPFVHCFAGKESCLR